MSEPTTTQNGYTLGKFADPLTVSKLSKLQRYILAKMAGGEQWRPCAFVEYFGNDLAYTTQEPNGLNDDGSRRFRTLYFNHSSDPRYKPAFAAISRAITRLEERGLVKRIAMLMGGGRTSWKCIGLTELGAEVSKRLVTTSIDALTNRLTEADETVKQEVK